MRWWGGLFYVLNGSAGDKTFLVHHHGGLSTRLFLDDDEGPPPLNSTHPQPFPDICIQIGRITNREPATVCTHSMSWNQMGETEGREIEEVVVVSVPTGTHTRLYRDVDHYKGTTVVAGYWWIVGRVQGYAFSRSSKLRLESDTHP